MDAFTADFLSNLAAELSAPVIAKVAGRFRQAWQGDESSQALQRCVYAGILAMVSRASLDAPAYEALLADIFTGFFQSREVANEVAKLVRQPLDGAELLFLFQEAGYDPETLPGLAFPTAVAAFEAAFLEQAAAEPALQPIIQVHQGWAQTALQQEMVILMRQMVAALQAQAGQTVGIQAGRIVAENVVSGVQHIERQTIYQWSEGTAVQTWENGYLKTLIGRCNRLDLAQVDERFLSDDGREVQLTDVFTTLYAARGEQVINRTPDQTVAQAVQGARKEMMPAGRRPEEAKEAEPLTAVSAVGGMSRLVVLGHPGGGKSSLVNYLASSLARQRLTAATTPLPDWPAEPLLPVRIILRRFAAWLAETIGRDVPEVKGGLVWRYLEEKLLPDWGCTEMYQPVKRILQNEGGVIFFDGLDEVPESVDDARRTLIKQTIVDFARPLDGCKIIVTCREYAYKKNDAWRLPQAQFPVIELALFQEEQIRQFARTWYRVMGPRQEWDAEKQGQEARRLADAVIAQPHLLELGQYPLLLTLMAQVHGRYSDRPENRADLYDQAVNLLLSHWENRLVRQADGSQQVEPGLIARLNLRREEVRSVLQAIAFAAHERQEGQQNRDNQAADISRDELWEGLLPLVGSYDRAKEVTDYIQQRSGLLQAREGFTYAFPHRTFQEFLAAAHVWSLPEDPVEALYTRLARDTAWWREIFLLAAGQKRDSANPVMLLVNRLTPAEPASAAVSDWQLVQAVLAAQTIYETNFRRFVRGQGADHPYVLLLARVRAWLETALAAENSLTPVKRAEAGRALGRWLEDTRPGVGLKPETGLPDIVWGEEVPAGTYPYQKTKVQIAQPYRFSRYPITYAQFQCFVAAEDFADGRWWAGMPEEVQDWDGSNYLVQEIGEQAFPYANNPRETVSWNQAIAFCRWLSDKLGYKIDLPTEQEWEVAARWPDNRTYPWGDEFEAEKANTEEGGIGQTTAVGLYPSGKNTMLKLYDLSGNVWEWCRNKYDNPDDDTVDDSNDWRALRGGSWFDNAFYARAACRDNLYPGGRFNFYGFRVVVRRPPSHLDH